MLVQPPIQFLKQLTSVSPDDMYLNPILINAKLTALQRGWKLQSSVAPPKIKPNQGLIYPEKQKAKESNDMQKVQDEHKKLEEFQKLGQRFGTAKTFTSLLLSSTRKRNVKQLNSQRTARLGGLNSQVENDGQDTKRTWKDQGSEDENYNEDFEMDLDFNGLKEDLNVEEDDGIQLNLANNTDEFMGSGFDDADDNDDINLYETMDDEPFDDLKVAKMEFAEETNEFPTGTIPNVQQNVQESEDEDDLINQYAQQYVRDDIKRANGYNEIITRGGGRILFQLIQSVTNLEIQYVPALRFETKPQQRSVSPKFKLDQGNLRLNVTKKPEVIITDGEDRIKITSSDQQCRVMDNQFAAEKIVFEDLPFFHAVRLRRCLEQLDKQEELERQAAELERQKQEELRLKKEAREKRRMEARAHNQNNDSSSKIKQSLKTKNQSLTSKLDNETL